MQLTLHAMSGLRVLRALRCGLVEGPTTWTRCDLRHPDAGQYQRFTAKRIREHLTRFGAAAGFSPARPLHVLVPHADERLQTKGVKCSYRNKELPPGSFVDLGGGVCIASPELLFLEMANVMDSAVLLLLGMELCGTYSRAPVDPLRGDVRYGIRPVATAQDLRRYLDQAQGIRGQQEAKEVADLLLDNAWSPREALVAALMEMPFGLLGMELGPIALNPRLRPDASEAHALEKTSRVPDIVFVGTSIGINYDGEDHFGIERVARAAAGLAMDPGNVARARELEEAKRDARACIVEDKRRDRDLLTLGRTVFAVTKEDLDEPGGFDRLAWQVVEALEQERGIELPHQRRVLTGALSKRLRQQAIWSLLPGVRGDQARAEIAEHDARVQRHIDELNLSLRELYARRADEGE